MQLDQQVLVLTGTGNMKKPETLLQKGHWNTELILRLLELNNKNDWDKAELIGSQKAQRSASRASM